MKRLVIALLISGCLTVPSVLSAQQHDQEDTFGQPLPTGRSSGLPTPERSKRMLQQPEEILPPKMEIKRRFDAAQARKNAQELAQLAQKIPAQVDLVSKHVLPKDLAQELKRIEKLAKHLRSEISY